MKAQPQHDYVLVRRNNAKDEKTAAGIIITSGLQEKPYEGEVVAIGPGKVLPNGELSPLKVKAGHQVQFHKSSFLETKVEGEDFLLMKEEAILLVLNP